MMLSTPSKDLAARLLKEVGYDKRLIGWRLRERSGMLPVTMYSLAELVVFLSDPYPGINLKAVQDWIGSILKDHELESKIDAVLLGEANNYAKMSKVRDLAGYRLLQCKKLI